jgi:hypothetical protein
MKPVGLGFDESRDLGVQIGGGRWMALTLTRCSVNVSIA